MTDSETHTGTVELADAAAQAVRAEWHSRYGGRGVLIYWHVERKSMAIHSQLIGCTAS